MRATKLITVLAAAFCILTVGVILNLPTMYWMCGILLSLPVSGYLYAITQPRRLSVDRRVPATGSVAEHLSVELTVHNGHPWPKLHLTVADELPVGLVAVGRAELPIHLPPRGSDRVGYVVRPEVRGLHRLGATRIESADPLGMSKRTTILPVRSEVLVYPRVIPLPPHLLPVGLTSSVSPMDSTGQRGEGNLFFGIREYRPGDPLRRIHWRSSARIGHLAVREMEQERTSEVILALETIRGSELGAPPHTSLEYGVTLAASLATVAARRGDSIRLVAPGWSVWRPSSEPGQRALAGIMETLARLRASAPQGVEHELLQHLGQITAGASVLWITPRLGPPLLQTVGVLQSAHVDVTVLALDPTSYDPNAPALDARHFGAQVTAMGAAFLLFRRGDDLGEVLAAVVQGGGR
ncbi:MAG: DUF58 domain-containing protein [Armatimonadetes bacterium]|nr:DUF58 domain-containing protein [Armatimonadota bacterium]